MLNAMWLVLGGTAIVFAALGILLGVMVVIKRVFPPQEGEGKEEA